MRHHSIVLDRSACTACDICVRECPTWCISLSSHCDTVEQPPARPRTIKVLDRFEINWGLCMYCGICIEECPFDALAWSEDVLPAASSLSDLVEQL